MQTNHYLCPTISTYDAALENYIKKTISTFNSGKRYINYQYINTINSSICNASVNILFGFIDPSCTEELIYTELNKKALHTYIN